MFKFNKVQFHVSFIIDGGRGVFDRKGWETKAVFSFIYLFIFWVGGRGKGLERVGKEDKSWVMSGLLVSVFCSIFRINSKNVHVLLTNCQLCT